VYPPSPEVLERRFSLERLEPYRWAVGGDLARAIELYEWNAQISACFWVTLGHVEILLRNAMHERLTAWSRETYHDPRWYLDHDGIFTSRTLSDIAKARERARGGKRRETPGGVVSGLTLGFWRYLLTKPYERSLWMPCLRHAWPDNRLRCHIHDPVAKLHELRNRIAHHEPIYNRNLAELHRTALTVAYWTCAEAAPWIERNCIVLRMLSNRPPTRASRDEAPL
jgi:hypothetical protein